MSALGMGLVLAPLLAGAVGPGGAKVGQTADAATSVAALRVGFPTAGSTGPGLFPVVAGSGEVDQTGVDGQPADGTSVQQLAVVLSTATSIAGLAVAPSDALLRLANPPVPATGKPLPIPAVVFDAYTRAARRLGAEEPHCGVSAALLGGIGRAESDHANGGNVDARGTTRRPILGPVLDGTMGTAVVLDTDGGRLDGNTTFDRAVGPMQFLPATWRRFGADGNNDGVTDINNVYDASLGAARYLCAGGQDVRDPTQAAAAVFRYNHSASYVATVLSWAAAYANGVAPAPTSVSPQSPGSTATAPQAPPAPKTSTPKTAPRTSAPDTSAAPAPSAPAPADPGSGSTSRPVVYVVRPGDNLSTIAWWFHVHGYGPIYDANRWVIGADPNLIFPGQRIVLTGTTMTIGN